MNDQAIQGPTPNASPPSPAAQCSATYSIYLLPYFTLLTPADVAPLATGVPEQRAKEVEAEFGNDARGAVVIIPESPNESSSPTGSKPLKQMEEKE